MCRGGPRKQRHQDNRQVRFNTSNNSESANINLVNQQIDEQVPEGWYGATCAFINMVARRMASTLPMLTLLICQTWVSVALDTGAELNVIDEATYTSLKTKPKMSQCTVTLYAYSNRTPIATLGQFSTRVDVNGIYKSIMFIVTKANGGNLLSYKSARERGIIGEVRCVNNVSTEEQIDPEYEAWKRRFPNVFGEHIGKLRNFQARLHIDESIAPQQQKLRHVPFHLRGTVEKELIRMLDNDIIEPTNGPTPWVSPIVPVPKANGEVRITTDARCVNRAIKRERHNMPLLEDLVVSLTGARCISKLDLRAGYNQIEIEPSSRPITTFATHMGLFRYKRLSMGINTAGDIFQKAIGQLLVGINGTMNFSDDIIVHGADKASHDANMQQVLERLDQAGLTLNGKKCEFAKREVDFFVFRFSDNGMSFQEGNIEALRQAKAPRTPGEVRSLLGLANYCASFIDDFATIVHPLRQLTKQNFKWEWGETHEQSLKRLKESLTGRALAYFNKEWTTVVTVDNNNISCSFLSVLLGVYTAEPSTTSTALTSPSTTPNIIVPD